MTTPLPQPDAPCRADWPATGDPIPLTVLAPQQAPQAALLGRQRGAADGPMVSCLMVSRGKLMPARFAIECFRRQSYRGRELVIIDDSADSELEPYLAALADPHIRLVKVPPGRRLGALRNLALAEARGELVCQWDDDDLYDAQRLTLQVAALLAQRADACFLQRWTLWWPAERRLAVSGGRLWEGSMLARRAAVPAYPDRRRGEDTEVAGRIAASSRIVLLDAPALYCYAIHGGNTFDHAHFLAIYNAASEFAGRDGYASHLERLGAHLPILDYARQLESRGAASRPAPPPLPDRYIDPAQARPGRAPGCAAPLVSIIVRSMDRPCLPQALHSLARQSYRELEVLVVDATGGRHPPLPDAIARDPRFRLLPGRRPLKRPAAANAGLDAARGEYLGFLDDDDLYAPDHVELLMRRIRQPDHPEMAYAGLWLVDRYHRLLRRQCNPFNPLTFHFFNLVPSISALFHRRLVELGCRFDESLEVFEDWDFWLQLAPHTRFERVDAVTQCYFVEAGNSGTGVGLNADAAKGGHYSMRVRNRWAPCSQALWREYTAQVQHLAGRFNDGERAELRHAMRALLRRYPDEANLECHLGRTYLAQGRSWSARRLFEAALSHNRGSLEFLQMLVQLWLAQGEPEDALACLELALPAQAQHGPAIQAEIERLRALLAARRAPAPRPGRNESCPCGSGARHKACCGRLDAAGPTAPAESGRLEATAAEHYRRGELSAARAAFESADAALPRRPGVNHALALLAYDCGRLDAAARHADIAAAGGDEVAAEFRRQVHYRRRRLAESDRLRGALLAGGRLLAPAAIRQLLAAAGDVLVLGCAQPFPLGAADFAGWPGRLRFLTAEAELPDAPADATLLVIDGIPSLLPAALDRWQPRQVLIRATRDCPAMLHEIAGALEGALGLVYPDRTTAGRIGLPGLVIRPAVTPAAAPAHEPARPWRVGLRGSCETDGLHPFDTALIRRLLAEGMAVGVHGGTPLLRHFPPAELPPHLDLLGFEASGRFLAGLDCLVLRRAPLAEGEAALGFVAEALAAGCALVCAAGVPGAELIADGRNGFLVAADDDDAILDRVRRLRCDRELALTLGAAARETARRHFGAGAWTRAARAPVTISCAA